MRWKDHMNLSLLASICAGFSTVPNAKKIEWDNYFLIFFLFFSFCFFFSGKLILQAIA